MKDTLDKILSKLKNFGLEVFAFLTSKIFIKNFAGVMSMLLILFFFTSWWLKCYTNTGEVLHMDNFVGMHIEDAYDLAQKKGFEIHVDSVPLLEEEPLTITKQHPKPNAPVKENRTVYLTVVQVLRELTNPPTLRGSMEDYDTYRKACAQRKINTKEIGSQYSRQAANTILEVIYKGDTITNQLRDGDFGPIPEGSTLQFIVSKRGKGVGSVKVPQLVCKTYGEAKFLLENSHLSYTTILDQTVVEKNRNGAYIWKQDPESGVLNFGEQVNLYVTQNLPDGCVTEENPLENPQEEDENEEF